MSAGPQPAPPPRPDPGGGSSVARWFDPGPGRLDATPKEREMLGEVDRRITGAASLEAAMDWLFERTARQFPCDRIGLAFIEEDGRRIVAHWARARYEPLRLDRGYVEDAAGSSLQEAMDTGRLRVIPDLEAYARERPSSRSTRLLLEEGVRSSLTCPLRAESRPVGFFFRSCRRPNAYTVRHVRLHQAMAERLGQAVEKAWRINRLEAANAAYLEMLGFASHDLRSPLAGIITNADLLLAGYLGPLPPAHRKRIERMKDSARNLHTMAEQYLELARIESGGLIVRIGEEADLWAQGIEPAIALQEGGLTAGKHPVERVGTVPLAARFDPTLIRTACANLIGNAAKYGEPGGAIRIRAERSGDRVSIAVWNRGAGFSAADRHRLFRRFSRLSPVGPAQLKGAGLGLYIVWQIAQAHGGRVSADSLEGEWAEFRIEWPG